MSKVPISRHQSGDFAQRPWEDAPACYKTTSTEVLDGWDDAQRRYKEFGEALDAFGEQYPNHKTQALRTGKKVWLVGLTGEDEPGPLWRLTSGHHGPVWVPRRTSKAGKALYAEVQTVSMTHMTTIPGMPSTAMVGNHWYEPGLFVLDGTAYVHWSCSFAEVENSEWSKQGLDEAIWTRIKRSVLYAAKEAVEDERAASATGGSDG